MLLQRPAAAPAPRYPVRQYRIFLLPPHFAAHVLGCSVRNAGSEGQLVLPRQVFSAGESPAR